MEQHFVPQFYLRGFRDSQVPESRGRNCVADLTENTVRRCAPKSVARRADYYVFRDREGAPTQEVERLLGQIESAAAPAVDRLLRGELEFSGQEWADLVFFAAVLATRVPFFRRTVERFATHVAETSWT